MLLVNDRFEFLVNEASILDWTEGSNAYPSINFSYAEE